MQPVDAVGLRERGSGKTAQEVPAARVTASYDAKAHGGLLPAANAGTGQSKGGQ